jgi:hypothetical protein
MFSKSSLRGTALLAAAFALAACGSDKAAGPTTSNNEQIISEMTTALQQAGDSESTEHYLALQAAIVGLSAGAPVNSGNVTIDGRSYRFSTTSITLEVHDSVSDETMPRFTLVVGWRHTDGDSLFLAMYAPEGSEVGLDMRAPAALMQRPRSGAPDLAALSTMLQSGRYTVSKSISAGPDQPLLFAAKLGSTVWIATSDQGIVSGSISYAATTGECDVDGANNSDIEVGADSCELLKSNLGLQADTFDGYSEADPPPAGPAISIPAQPVIGVKLISETSSTVP